MYVLTLKLFARPLFIFGSAVFAPLSLSTMRTVMRPHTSQNDHLLPTIPARVLYVLCAESRERKMRLCLYQSIRWQAREHFTSRGVCFFSGTPIESVDLPCIISKRKMAWHKHVFFTFSLTSEWNIPWAWKHFRRHVRASISWRVSWKQGSFSGG
jgi:hypothetical protein